MSEENTYMVEFNICLFKYSKELEADENIYMTQFRGIRATNEEDLIRKIKLIEDKYPAMFGEEWQMIRHWDMTEIPFWEMGNFVIREEMIPKEDV